MRPRARTGLVLLAAATLAAAGAAAAVVRGGPGGPATAGVPPAPVPVRATAAAGTAPAWAVRLPHGPDDPGPAVAVAAYLERAVTLDPGDRLRWSRAVSRPGSGPAAARFVDGWVDGLVAGLDVRPDPLLGTATGVSVRTLGGRVLGSNDPGLARVILWQQVTVGTDPPTSAYLLAFATVAPTPDGPLLVTVDGIRPGPSPDAGTAMVYPRLER